MATPIGGAFEYLTIYFGKEKNVQFRLDTVFEFFMEHW